MLAVPSLLPLSGKTKGKTDSTDSAQHIYMLALFRVVLALVLARCPPKKEGPAKMVSWPGSQNDQRMKHRTAAT